MLAMIGLLLLLGGGTTNVQLVDAQGVPLSELAVRVETPLGVMVGKTDDQGRLAVPRRFPLVVLVLGEQRLALPGELELAEEGATTLVCVPEELAQRLRGGR